MFDWWRMIPNPQTTHSIPPTPQPKPIEVQVVNYNTQRYAVWFGGSMLASTVCSLIFSIFYLSFFYIYHSFTHSLILSPTHLPTHPLAHRLIQPTHQCTNPPINAPTHPEQLLQAVPHQGRLRRVRSVHLQTQPRLRHHVVNAPL